MTTTMRFFSLTLLALSLTLTAYGQQANTAQKNSNGKVETKWKVEEGQKRKDPRPPTTTHEVDKATPMVRQAPDGDQGTATRARELDKSSTKAAATDYNSSRSNNTSRARELDKSSTKAAARGDYNNSRSNRGTRAADPGASHRENRGANSTRSNTRRIGKATPLLHERTATRARELDKSSTKAAARGDYNNSRSNRGTRAGGEKTPEKETARRRKGGTDYNSSRSNN